METARHPYPFVPGPVTLEVVASEGSYLITADGRRVLDAAGGAIVANIGHGRRAVRDAMMASLERLDYVVPSFATPERVTLVERLRRSWLPGRLTRAYFTSGGSEAADAALRLARLHFLAKGEPQRTKIIGRDLGYHGTTLATLDIGGHDARREPFAPLLRNIRRVPTPYPLRHRERTGGADCATDCADALAAAIEAEGPETVAAIIAEPITGASGGAIVPPDGYWPAVQDICRRYGILLILDEVMVGFGRTGARFALEHFGLDPDIMIAGKGLTAGYAPLVGLFATDAVVAPLAQTGEGLMFYTYGGTPAACAAADAVLAIMEREDLVARSAAMGARLMDALAPLADHPHVAEIRGRGLFLGIEIVADKASLAPFPPAAAITQKVFAAGLAEDVFFYRGGTGRVRDVIVLGPPLTITDDEIARVAAVLPRAIDAAVASATA